jgi:hypothetical protein
MPQKILLPIVEKYLPGTNHRKAPKTVIRHQKAYENTITMLHLSLGKFQFVRELISAHTA